jgi:catechol 2,3-dioxygenase-like lactoylglutathione lyase family enzyme
MDGVVKFHLSLNVSNLTRAVDFYRVLFGREPAKCHADYAKFEVDDPPVIFSLVPHPPSSGGTLSHAGLRVGNDETIQRYRERLELAGICTQAQNDTVCGYAKQNKLWVKDPDGNFWEIYHIEEDVDPYLVRKSLEGTAARSEPIVSPAEPIIWEHFVTSAPPERIPHDNASVDEVRLVGTYNADITDEQCRMLVAEVRRVLKPGGKVLLHGLMADKPFTNGPPKLPGLAAMVSRVPVQSQPLEALTRAGFVGLQVVKYTEKPWFTHGGAELREVKLVGWQPHANGSGTKTVIYKGPFAQAKADCGLVFPRAERVEVTPAVWQHLREGPAAEQFLFLEPGADSECSM